MAGDTPDLECSAFYKQF